MKKPILTVLAFFISLLIFGQTPLNSFQCNIKIGQSLTPDEICNFISKINFENYRLQNRRITLSFDNGFDIVLLSAAEAQAQGLINNASGYPAEFISKYKMPIFHMTPDGRVSAAYPVINSKYSTEKHR
jgi:hypothetical protein